ncbi:MAG TPA: hypothetical protein VF042_06985 [Gemmatimonadaceae bacterium]
MLDSNEAFFCNVGYDFSVDYEGRAAIMANMHTKDVHSFLFLGFGTAVGMRNIKTRAAGRRRPVSGIGGRLPATGNRQSGKTRSCVLPIANRRLPATDAGDRPQATGSICYLQPRK